VLISGSSILMQQSVIDDQVGGGWIILSFIAPLLCNGGMLVKFNSSSSLV